MFLIPKFTALLLFVLGFFFSVSASPSAAFAGDQAALVRLLEDYPHEKVTLQRQVRNAVNAHSSFNVSENIHLPKDARLYFAWAVKTPDPGPKGSLEFKISIQAGTLNRTVFFKKFDSEVPDNASQWTDEYVDLGNAEDLDAEITMEITWAPRGWGHIFNKRENLPSLWIASPVIYSKKHTGPTPVILIGIDTLRADRLSSYGNPLHLTPAIDQLAEDGVVFKNAFSPSSWTLPSFASVLTGVYPEQHGAVRRNHKLGEAHQTLTEILRSNGYFTAGFHDGGYVSAPFGFAQGFDIYEQIKGWSIEADSIVELVNTEWLKRSQGLPLFLFVHTYDPHAPYGKVPSKYHTLYTDPNYRDPYDLKNLVQTEKFEHTKNFTKRDIDYYRGLYDGAVRFTDDRLKVLFDLLKQLGLYDTSYIFFHSDHGEEFNEHGRYGHTKALYRESVHVPLIITGPDIRRSATVEKMVSTIEIMPTLLGLLKLKTPVKTESLIADLIPGLLSLATADFSTEGPVISQLIMEDMTSLRTPEWTLIRQGETVELYNRKTDPEETHDLKEGHEVTIKRLLKIHDEKLKTSAIANLSPKVETIEHDEHMLERLRSLGYL